MLNKPPLLNIINTNEHTYMYDHGFVKISYKIFSIQVNSWNKRM